MTSGTCFRTGRTAWPGGFVWHFFRGRGGKNPRWKPLKVDKVGRVTLCMYNEPAEVSMAQLVLEAFGPAPAARPRAAALPRPDLRNNAIENLRWVPDATNLVDHPALVEAGKKRIPHREPSPTTWPSKLSGWLAQRERRSPRSRPVLGWLITPSKGFSTTKPLDQHLEQPPRTSGRYRRGQAHYAAAPLTPEKIEEAAGPQKEGRTLEEIGAPLGCKANTVSRALSGVTWKHLQRSSDAGSGPPDDR